MPGVTTPTLGNFVNLHPIHVETFFHAGDIICTAGSHSLIYHQMKVTLEFSCFPEDASLALARFESTLHNHEVSIYK